MPYHYGSFLQTLETHFGARVQELPRRPLVVDLGCGPGTTATAIANWLLARRGYRHEISYLGIDASSDLVSIAREFLHDPSVFANVVPSSFLPSVENVSSDIAAPLLANRDGVVFAMSYILHHEFMLEGTPLTNLMQRIASFAPQLPAWFALQDANKPYKITDFEDIWPETILRRVSNSCSRFRYFLSPRYTLISPPWISLNHNGHFVETPRDGGSGKVITFGCRLTYD